MTATSQPDEPLVIGLSVLYEDEPDGRVIAHMPRCLRHWCLFAVAGAR
jgi:hypothetical protein